MRSNWSSHQSHYICTLHYIALSQVLQYFSLLTHSLRKIRRNIAYRDFSFSAKKTGCWFVGGDDLTGACMSYSSDCDPDPIIIDSSKFQNGNILVLANPGSPGKWPLNQRDCFGRSSENLN